VGTARRRAWLVGIAAVAVCVAIALFAREDAPLGPAVGYGGEAAASQVAAKAEVGGVAEPDPASREAPIETSTTSPWDPAALARLRRDAFGRPWEQKPFLHAMLNLTDPNSPPEFSSMYTDPPEVVDGLPEPFRSAGKGRLKELADLTASHRSAAREMILEYHRMKCDALHHAVERDEFLFVDHTGKEPPDIQKQNEATLAAANLGVMDDDFYVVVSSAKPPGGGESGPYSALIYIRRRDYPRVFELIEEVYRLKHDGEQEILRQLGYSR
jgi:hypothetical protein